MKRFPIGAWDLSGAENIGNGIFHDILMSHEERCRRQADLALNNPHIPSFDIFMVSQLPLEQQEADLRRRSEQHRRREEQRQIWLRQMEAMNRQFEEITSYQRSSLELLARLVCPPPRFRLLPSVRSHLNLTAAGGAGNRHPGPVEVITIDDDDDDTEIGHSNGRLIPQKQATQKCPFCSKNLSTGHISRHVHLHCKSARKEMNSRQDWDCMRHKRK